MPATVHKLLIHGKDIITTSLVPIGQLSEEIQKARVKDMPAYRERYSRKFSKESSNMDILNNLIFRSKKQKI